MQIRLFKITWKIPYAKYETYVFGIDENEAQDNFEEEVRKEVKSYEIEKIEWLPLNGVVVTKHLSNE